MKSLELDRQRTLHASKQKNLELRWYMLTPKEREVCKLMLDGLGNSAIADRLEIQPDTANKHRMKLPLHLLMYERRPQIFGTRHPAGLVITFPSSLMTRPLRRVRGETGG